jgi:hypothetical protein
VEGVGRGDVGGTSLLFTGAGRSGGGERRIIARHNIYYDFFLFSGLLEKFLSFSDCGLEAGLLFRE